MLWSGRRGAPNKYAPPDLYNKTHALYPDAQKETTKGHPSLERDAFTHNQNELRTITSQNQNGVSLLALTMNYVINQSQMNPPRRLISH